MNGDRCREDRGSGLISTIAGLLVFLVLMLFAVQTLVGLYTRSMATDAAFEGARIVAGARTQRDSSPVPVDARVHAEEVVRQQLGKFGNRVDLDWSASTWDEIALRLRAQPLGFLWGSFRGGTGGIDRTVRVRVERFQ